jgi:hypothetical protein
VRASVAAYGEVGFEANGAGAILIVDGCLSTGNGDGVLAANGGVVRVSNTTVTRSRNFGFRNNGGTFYSFGNNTLAGNTATSTGTISAAYLK